MSLRKSQSQVKFLYQLASSSYVLVLLILGTTTLWPIADGMLLWWFYRKGEIRWCWFTVGIFVIGVLNGILNLHLFPIMWGLRIVLVYSLVMQYRLCRDGWSWIVAGLLLTTQAVFMMWQVDIGNTRPYGFSLNALLAADLGYAFLISPMWPIAVVIIALSGSRGVLLAVVVMAIFQRSRSVFGLALVTVFVGLLAMFTLTPERLGLERVIDDADARVETFDNGKQLGSECGEIRDVELTFDGYGVGLFCDATGRQGPHNVFVMSAYSLGLLVIPFWAIVMLRFGFRHSHLLAGLFVIASLTDDLFSRPEGVYVLALLAMHVRLYFGTRDFRLNPVE